jgi:hypothetical protein
MCEHRSLPVTARKNNVARIAEGRGKTLGGLADVALSGMCLGFVQEFLRLFIGECFEFV